jgi:hypothetical protein
VRAEGLGKLGGGGKKKKSQTRDLLASNIVLQPLRYCVAQHDENVYGVILAEINLYLTSAIERTMQTALRPGRFIPLDATHSINYVRG